MDRHDLAGDFLFEGFRLERCGLFRLNPAGGAEPVALGSRALDLILLLAGRHGEVVSKDAILDAVWLGTAVEESNLTVQVSALRRVLDRDRAQGSCIQTVPGRGYRFVAAVTRPEDAAGPLDPGVGRALPSAAVPAAILPDKPSIAVLPFQNMSGDPEQEHFADGMVEEIITALSRIRRLFVIARNSSFTYKGQAVDVRRVGRELGARYVLEGSIRRTGSRTRIAAQLIDATTGAHLWADRFDGLLEDAFALQDKVAASVADSIISALQIVETAAAPANAAPGVPEAAPRPAERRLVTVLYCRILGATAWASACDPEEAQAALGAVHEASTRIFERYRGTLLHQSSDGVMACFGHPEAGEDDAERAVRAGLHLVAAVADICTAGLRLHIGVATGPAVIGALPGNGAGTIGVLGEAPEHAERLVMTASADGVLISERAHCLAGRVFEYREAGTFRPDQGEPVRFWQVVAEAPFTGRFAARHEPDAAPFIGRKEELGLLLRRWSRARHGAGQVVLISGEPGIGKSRLADAFAERLGAERHARMRCFGSPDHRNTELFPIIGHLERAAGFARGDTAEEKLAKLAALAAETGCAAREALQLLASLLSLPADDAVLERFSPRQRRERTLALLLAMVERLAAQQPVFVLFEDAHWFDPTSLELLALTVERAQRLPLLLIATARPDFAPPWADQPQVTVLPLARLPQSEAAALIRRIARDHPLSAGLVAEIVARGDGVPLFLEELTKAALADDPVRQERPREVPITLEGLLLSRLDRLGPAREIAQLGAVIGRTFSHELLAILAESDGSQGGFDAALARLVGSELVYRQGVPSDARYRFKHALVRDAAYASLSRRRRRVLHARTARALEEKFPEIVEAEPERLARHHQEAVQYEAALGYWMQAGDLAARLGASREAATHYRAALALLPQIGDEQKRLQLDFDLSMRLADAMIQSDGFVALEREDLYARARAVALKSGRMEQYVEACAGMGATARFSEFLDMFAVIDREQLSRMVPPARIRAAAMTGIAHYYLGNLGQAWRSLEQAMRLDDAEHCPAVSPIGGSDATVALRGYCAWVRASQGYLEQAAALVEQALAVALERHHTYSITWSKFLKSEVLLRERRYREAEQLADEVIDMCACHGFVARMGSGLVSRGAARVALGRVGEGLTDLRNGFARTSAGGRFQRTVYAVAAAAPLINAGLYDEAESFVQEGERALGDSEERIGEAELLRLRGRLLAAGGQTQAAVEKLHAALAVAERQGAKLFSLRAAADLAPLLQVAGNDGAG